MGRRSTIITEEIADQMRELSANGMGVSSIARLLKVSYHCVRVRVDPIWAKKCYLQQKEWRHKRMFKRSERRHGSDMQQRPDLYWPSFTSLFFGDPPIGRSALDHRENGTQEASSPRAITTGVDTIDCCADTIDDDSNGDFSITDEGVLCNGTQRA